MEVKGLNRIPNNWPKSTPFAVALAFVALAAALGPGVVWADTVQYLRIAHILQGIPVERAWLDAYTLWCSHPSLAYPGTLDNCITTTMAGRGPIIGWIDRNLPYQEIFSPRVGYPLLSIPFMRVFGDREGLWIVAVAATTIGGLLVARIAQLAGLALFPGLVAQIAFYLLPVSLPHGLALLAEGPTLAAALVMTLGLVHVLRGSSAWGLAMMGLGLGLVFFFKYSSTLLLSVSFLVVCLCMLAVRQYRQQRQVRLAATAAAVSVGLSLVVNKALGFPGLSHSLQDTFTDHFRLPPVDDPFAQLLQLEFDYVGKFLLALPANALYLAIFVAALAGFVLAYRSKAIGPEAWAPVALSVYGVLSVIAHPVYKQAERLGSSLWVGVAVGLALLAAEVHQRKFGKVAAPVQIAAASSPR